MDSDELRAILTRSRVGIWALIDTAIRVASSDYGDEFRRRRDKIVEALYTPAAQLCQNCNSGVVRGEIDCRNKNRDEHEHDDVDVDVDIDDDDDDKKVNDRDNRNRIEDFNNSKSPLTPESNHRNLSGGEEEEDVDPYGGLFDDEQTTILSIKEQLEDPQQSDDSVVELLQSLEDMEITFQALKDTDIGRHVNRLRKHSSNEVRRLVKLLVRKWKETVDEWVKVNQPQAASNLIADGDSPQQNISKYQQNGHHQVPDFGYSPNPRNGSSSVSTERSYVEPKPKPPQSAPRREAPSRPPQSTPKSAPVPSNRVQRDSSTVDDERLNSARRRLQENYQEANNAKKQRTIQVMDIHELPKPKNGFFAKNRGGFQGRHR